MCLKCLYYMLYLINTTLMCRKLLEVVFIFSMEFSNSCGFPSLCKYLLNRDHPATTLICIWLNLLLIYVSPDYRNLIRVCKLFLTSNWPLENIIFNVNDKRIIEVKYLSKRIIEVKEWFAIYFRFCSFVLSFH